MRDFDCPMVRELVTMAVLSSAATAHVLCSCQVTGWHVADDGRRYGQYTLRIHAYAGQPFLRVFHTFVNSDLPENSRITSIGLRVPAAGAMAWRITHDDEYLRCPWHRYLAECQSRRNDAAGPAHFYEFG